LKPESRKAGEHREAGRTSTVAGAPLAFQEPASPAARHVPPTTSFTPALAGSSLAPAKRGHSSLLLCAAIPLLFLVTPFHPRSPSAALWTFPLMLAASLVLAWAAESAQFFVAQGLALALLAWLQTAPEFAVEAVVAWKQQTELMVANLTGALRLLTGLGWPMIYFTAAFFHRRRYGKRLDRIRLHDEHAVEVVGLIAPIVYFLFIYYKARLEIYDGIILAGIYGLYLCVLRKMPHKEEEEIQELERVPRKIMQTRPPYRGMLIWGLFALGGIMIYFVAEPFLGSILAIATAVGIPGFVSVQWMAPFMSEFPEKVSAFYWARTITKAPVALMNMVSSNINQWTMLPALLPVVYAISMGSVVPIRYSGRQDLEILMTIGQALVAVMLLMNMSLDWWEASLLFLLWAVQFSFSPFGPAISVSKVVTAAYFLWFFVEVLKNVTGRRKWEAIRCFAQLMRKHW
jgi:cation:H+ antiporter